MPQKRPFPRICIALGLADAAKLLEHARQEADSGETFLEFRLDYLDNPEHGIKVIRDLLKVHAECIILVTCRRHQNQGKFNGSVEEQLRILDSLSCQQAQGYLLAPPTSAAEARWLMGERWGARAPRAARPVRRGSL